ncbi:MAG: hypothetical protein U9P70_03800 [Patescibacteria group bacterium]|nr:hypothetical protein [Patescibacteria group bacterium]
MEAPLMKLGRIDQKRIGELYMIMIDTENIFGKLTSQIYLKQIYQDASNQKGERILLEKYLEIARTLFMEEMDKNLQVFSEAGTILSISSQENRTPKIFHQIVYAGKDILDEYVSGREAFYEKEVELLLISFTIAYFTNRIEMSNPKELFKEGIAKKVR